MKETFEFSGHLFLGPGNVYTSIQRLKDSGLVQPLEESGRKKAYALTF